MLGFNFHVNKMLMGQFNFRAKLKNYYYLFTGLKYLILRIMSPGLDLCFQKGNEMTMRNLFLKHVAQTSPSPMALEIVSANGIWLEDQQGKKYMDMICGIGPSLLGHAYPPIVNAIKEQVDKYLHTLVYGEMILSPQVQLASKLTSILPENLDNVYFLSAGTESTEAAMKLAKRHTGRYEICAFKDAYHGSSQGAVSLMSEDYFTSAYRPLLPGIRWLLAEDTISLDRITDQTAAVIVEPVKAESGIYPLSETFLWALRQKCDESGALLIFDEIQSGYGRTGYMFAFEKYGVVPDILLLGKGFGGGMPLSAVVSGKSILSALSDNPVLGHITTMGGHPVCCAAGLATLNNILDNSWIQDIPEKEALFKSLIHSDHIVEIRSAGLWFAIEFEDAQTVQKVIANAIQEGLISDWFLFNDKSIRIAPPLIITYEEIYMACEKLNTAMKAL